MGAGHTDVRALLICAVLVTVGTVGGFTLGWYARPVPVDVPCELVPVIATPDDPCQFTVCAGGNRAA